MKSRASFLALAIIIGFAVGFWLYGIGRTMRETVNFDGKAFWFGLLLGFILPLAVVALFRIVGTLWPRLKPLTPPSAFIALGVALLVGSLLSEWWILRDERKFSAETSQASLDKLYSRPRAWPNSTCGLVFVPGQGVHATD